MCMTQHIALNHEGQAQLTEWRNATRLALLLFDDELRKCDEDLRREHAYPG